MAEAGLVAGAFFLSLSWLLSTLAIEVRTEGRCPPAEEVEQRLAPILPLAPSAPSRNDVALVDERADGSLTLSLSRADGTLLGQRRLPRAATCADQADTVAVTLAVWEAEIHPEIALRLDRLPAPGVPPRGADAGAGPPPGRPPATAPPVSPPAAAVAARVAAAPAPRGGARLGLGVALGAAAAPSSPGTIAPSARVDLTLAGDSRWRARLSAVGVGERTMAVAPGEVGWRRLYLVLAAEREVARSRGDRWAMVLGGGPAVGVVGLAGSGYPIDRSASSLDAGVEAAARLERWFGRLGLWLAATTTVWLRSQEVEVLGAPEVAPALPRVDAMAVLGGSFFSRR
jgi:hypothetical protein